MKTPSPIALISGRWAVSLRVWVIIAVLSQITSFTRTARVSSESSLIDVVPGVVAAIAFGAVLLVADRTVLRSRRVSPVGGWLVLGIWLVASVVRFLVLDETITAVAGEPADFSLDRLVTGVVSVVGWLWILSAYFAVRDHYLSISRDLATSQDLLMNLSDRQLKDYEGLRRSLSSCIEDAVLPSIAALRNEVEVIDDDSSQQELLALAERAGGESRLLVRSVSHGISRGELAALRSTEALQSSDEVRGVQAPWMVSVLLAPLLIALSILPIALTNFGVGALALTLLAFPAWFGVFVLLRWLQYRLSNWPPATSFGFVLLSNLVAVSAGLAMMFVAIPAMPRPKSPLLVLGLCVVALLAGMTASAMSRALSGLRKGSEIIAEQNRLISEASVKLESSTVSLRHQVAQMLHGPVQGRLAAVALSLNLFVDAQRNGRFVSGEATFRRCRALLEQVNTDIDLIMKGGPGTNEPIEVSANRLSQRWSGLIEIHFSISDSALSRIDGSRALQERVMAVIEESINNAVSHGRATSMAISVGEVPPDAIQVEAFDDGQGLSLAPTPGLGLREIESLGGSWTLQPVQGSGARLIVTLPGEQFLSEEGRLEHTDQSRVNGSGSLRQGMLSMTSGRSDVRGDMPEAVQR